MLELFIEFTNQIFWDGYAQQLSAENPTVFQFKYNEFISSYQSERRKKKRWPVKA